VIRTARLLLRQWRDSDLAPFAALNADPEVREFFPGTLDRAASDASAGRMRAHVEAHGFGFWAAEIPEQEKFIGFIGLMHTPDNMPFAPAVEIGWRLARRFWGFGYATEAARASLEYGFGELGLVEIVSLAASGNRRSRAVMERIGMWFAGMFDHPDMAEGEKLREHALYRIRYADRRIVEM
jgi:RimJ/RimL family protein N-acetyltransferase